MRLPLRHATSHDRLIISGLIKRVKLSGMPNGDWTSKHAPVSDMLRMMHSTPIAVPNIMEPPLKVLSLGARVGSKVYYSCSDKGAWFKKIGRLDIGSEQFCSSSIPKALSKNRVFAGQESVRWEPVFRKRTARRRTPLAGSISQDGPSIATAYQASCVPPDTDNLNDR